MRERTDGAGGGSAMLLLGAPRAGRGKSFRRPGERCGPDDHCASVPTDRLFDHYYQYSLFDSSVCVEEERF